MEWHWADITVMNENKTHISCHFELGLNVHWLPIYTRSLLKLFRFVSCFDLAAFLLFAIRFCGLPFMKMRLIYLCKFRLSTIICWLRRSTRFRKNLRKSAALGFRNKVWCQTKVVCYLQEGPSLPAWHSCSRDSLRVRSWDFVALL